MFAGKIGTSSDSKKKKPLGSGHQKQQLYNHNKTKHQKQQQTYNNNQEKENSINNTTSSVRNIVVETLKTPEQSDNGIKQQQQQEQSRSRDTTENLPTLNEEEKEEDGEVEQQQEYNDDEDDTLSSSHWAMFGMDHSNDHCSTLLGTSIITLEPGEISIPMGNDESNNNNHHQQQNATSVTTTTSTTTTTTTPLQNNQTFDTPLRNDTNEKEKYFSAKQFKAENISPIYENENDHNNHNNNDINIQKQHEPATLQEAHEYIHQLEQRLKQAVSEKEMMKSRVSVSTPVTVHSNRSTVSSYQSKTSTIPTTPKGIENLWERNKTLVKEIRFADQTCVEVGNENKHLLQQVQILQAEKESLKQETDEAKRISTKSQAENEFLQSEKEVLKQEIAEANRISARSQAENQFLRQRVDELQKQVNEITDSIQSKIEKETKTLELELHNTRSQLHECKLQLEASQIKFHSKEENFIKKIEELDLDITEKDSQIHHLHTDNAEKSKMIYELESNLERTTNELNTIQVENEKIIKDMEILQKTTNDQFESSLQDANEKINLLQSDNNKLLKELDDCKQKLLLRDDEYELVVIEKNELKEELDERLEELNSLRDEYITTYGLNEESENEVNSLKVEIETYQSQLQQFQEEECRLKDINNDLTNTISDRDKEINEMKIQSILQQKQLMNKITVAFQSLEEHMQNKVINTIHMKSVNIEARIAMSNIILSDLSDQIIFEVDESTTTSTTNDVINNSNKNNSEQSITKNYNATLITSQAEQSQDLEMMEEARHDYTSPTMQQQQQHKSLHRSTGSSISLPDRLDVVVQSIKKEKEDNNNDNNNNNLPITSIDGLSNTFSDLSTMIISPTKTAATGNDDDNASARLLEHLQYMISPLAIMQRGDGFNKEQGNNNIIYDMTTTNDTNSNDNESSVQRDYSVDSESDENENENSGNSTGNKRILVLEEEIKKLSSQLIQEQSTLNEALEKNQNLENRLSAAQEDERNLRNELDSLGIEKNEYGEKLNTALEVVEQTEKDLSQSREEIVKLKELLCEKENEISLLRNSFSMTPFRNNESNQNDFKTTPAVMWTPYVRNTQEHDNDDDKSDPWNKKIQTLKEQSARKTSRIVPKLTESTKSATKQIYPKNVIPNHFQPPNGNSFNQSDSQNVGRDVESNVKLLKEKVAVTTAEMEQVKKDYEAAKREQHRLEVYADELAASLASDREQHSRREKELEKEVQYMFMKIDSLKENYEAEISTLKQNLTDKKMSFEQVQNELSIAERDVKQAKEEANHLNFCLEQEREKFSSELNEYKKDIDSILEEQHFNENKYRDEIARLEHEIDEARASLESVEAQRDNAIYQAEQSEESLNNIRIVYEKRERGMQQSINHLTDENETLRNETAAAKLVCDELKLIQQDLECQRKELTERANYDAKQFEATLETTRKTFDAKDKSSQETIRSLTAERNSLMKECQNVKVDAEKANARTKEFEHERCSYIEQIDLLSTQLKKCRDDYQFLEEQISSAEKRLKEVEDERDDAICEADDYQKKLTAVESDLTKCKESLTSAQKNRDELNSYLCEKEQELSLSVDSFNQRIKSMQNHINEKERVINDLEISKNNLISELDFYSNELANLQSEQENINVALKSRIQERDALASRLRDTESSLQQKHNELSSSLERCDYLELELSMSRSETNENSRKLTALNAEKEVLQTKCNRLRDYIRKLTTKCDEWEVFHQKQILKMQQLKDAYLRLRNQAAELANRYQRENHLYTVERTRAENLKNELDEIARELSINESNMVHDRMK